MAEKQLAESLECGICLDEFRQPRVLPCLHGFCGDCLETLCEGRTEIPCPICQKPTTLPKGGVAEFPTHLIRHTNAETHNEEDFMVQQASLGICTQCNVPDKKATVHCMDCEEAFCNTCHTSHDSFKAMKGHRVVTVEQYESEEYELASQDQQCTDHEGETRKFYCYTCKQPVCRDCLVMKQHCRDHDYTTLKDESKKQAARLDQLVKEGNLLKKKCQKSIEDTDAVDKVLAASSKKADEYVERIKKRHMAMIAEVYDKYKVDLQAKKDKHVIEIKHLRDNVQTYLDRVEDACKRATSATKTASDYETVSLFPSLSDDLEEVIKKTEPTTADEELGCIDIETVTALEFPDIGVVLKSEGLTSKVGKTTWDVQTAASASSYTHARRPVDNAADRRRNTRSSDVKSQHRDEDFEEPLHLKHRNDKHDKERALSASLLDRRNERERYSAWLPNSNRRPKEEVHDIFVANESRFTHQDIHCTQTSILPSNVRHIHSSSGRDPRRGSTPGSDTRLTSSASESGRDDLNRFGMHKFSLLPNLGSNQDDGSTQDLPGNYTYGRGSSEGSRTSPISTQNNFAHGYGSDSSRTLSKYGRSQNDTRSRGYGPHSTSGCPPPYQSNTGDLHTSSGHPPPYQNSTDDPTLLGASGGVSVANNESLVQTILNQHESGHQTPEQVEETQTLLDHLLGTTDDTGTKDRSRRSRRTQSLDRASRKSKGKDHDLGGGYDLHSDPRVKRRDDGEEYKKCSVCFSKRDLSSRKDCSHKLCRSCNRIGLYKGHCSFCKSKTRTPRSVMRGRSKTKNASGLDSKTLNPLHGHKDFHVIHGSPTALSSPDHPDDYAY